MHKNSVKIEFRQQRSFSEEFRKKQVEIILKRQMSVSEMSRIYKITRATIYNWIFRYSSGIQKGVRLVVQMESEEYKTKKLEFEVAELQRIVGQKQLALEFMEKLFELANTELGYDLKKKLELKLSTGSIKTKKSIGIQ